MDLQAHPLTQPLQVEADELTIISQDNLTSKNRSFGKNLKKKIFESKIEKVFALFNLFLSVFQCLRHNVCRLNKKIDSSSLKDLGQRRCNQLIDLFTITGTFYSASRLFYTALCKEWCVLLMVVVSIPPHTESDQMNIGKTHPTLHNAVYSSLQSSRSKYLF